jgi:hypothetical protein
MITAKYAHFTIFRPTEESSPLAPAERCGVFAQVACLRSGAGERIRTADLPFTRRLLCQLSYTGGRLGAW